METISVRKLTKRYGKLLAVDGISLDIRKGEIFGLLGPNGAGKSTTLLMLSTLLAPTSGSATVNGHDIRTEPAAVRDSIGMVFQDPSSDELLTAYENLKLHALMYDVPLREIDRRIDDALGLVDLRGRKNDQVKKYSGGMRRRMEIARGLLHEPAVLFLDEPTIGLDPQTRKHIWEYIRGLASRREMTIILTTHYMEEADQLCDRVAIIDGGRIVALGAPAELKAGIKGDLVTLTGKALKLSGVQKLPFVQAVERNGGKACIHVTDAAKNLPRLLRVAGAVDSVEVHSPDFDDVFLRYTGKAIRDGDADATEYMRTMARAKK